MADNPQQEYWKLTWKRAQENMPIKLSSKGKQIGGQVATLMRMLDLDMSTSYKKNKPHKKNINYKDYPVVYNGRTKGVSPKDPEVRRKLEVCAGPYGRFLSYQKLKRMGLGEKYGAPK
jgi:hypothetical protein